MASREKRAVVLLSGGIDYATTAAIAREQGFRIHALCFRYGQRHEVECEAASRIAMALQVESLIFQEFNLRLFGGSALTDNIAVPNYSASPERQENEIPQTYVPARNTIFLAFALSYAETIPAFDIFIGVNAQDYSGYPDCRPEFISAFECLARVATRAGIQGDEFRVQAPLMNMNKAQIIREGLRLGVDYSLTHSCYNPAVDGRACGACDSCAYRRRGFEQAGVPDPTIYV